MSDSTAAIEPGLPTALDGDVPHAPVPLGAKHRILARAGETFRGGGRGTLLSLIDQALVSGVRFGLTLLVGRLAGKTELGVYALGFSWIVVFASLQEALITIPFTAYAARFRGDRRDAYRSAVWRQHAALAVCSATAVAAVGATLLATRGAADDWVHIAGVLVLAAPCSLAWEFGRRIAFADERIELALGVDSLTAALQLSGVALLYEFNLLTAASCLAASSIAWLISGAVAAGATRSFLGVSTKRVLVFAKKNWTMSRWMLSSQLVRTVEVYLPVWVAVYLIPDGERAAGELAACLTLITITNPVVLGVTNVLGPKLARSFAEGGMTAVGNSLATARRGLAAMLGVVAVVAIFAGDQLIAALFGGEFHGLGRLTTLLGLVVLTLPWNIPAATALWAIDRADVDFRIGAASLALHAVLSLPLTWQFGLVGTVWAMIGAGVFAGFARTRAVGAMQSEFKRGGL